MLTAGLEAKICSRKFSLSQGEELIVQAFRFLVELSGEFPTIKLKGVSGRFVDSETLQFLGVHVTDLGGDSSTLGTGYDI